MVMVHAAVSRTILREIGDTKDPIALLGKI